MGRTCSRTGISCRTRTPTVPVPLPLGLAGDSQPYQGHPRQRRAHRTHRMMIFSWKCPYKIRNSPAMRRSTSTTGPPGSKGRQHHGPSTGYSPSPTRRRSGQTSQKSSTGSINQPLKDCQSQCDDAPIRLMPCNPFPVRTGNGGSSLLSILEYCSSY